IDQIANESRAHPQAARAGANEVTAGGGQTLALAGDIVTLTLALRRPDDPPAADNAPPYGATLPLHDRRAQAGVRRTAAPARPAPSAMALPGNRTATRSAPRTFAPGRKYAARERRRRGRAPAPHPRRPLDPPSKSAPASLRTAPQSSANKPEPTRMRRASLLA